MDRKTEILIVVGAANLYIFFVFGRFLMKALGFFTYDTEEERLEYKKWLKKEGTYRAVMAIIILILALFETVWFFFVN